MFSQLTYTVILEDSVGIRVEDSVGIRVENSISSDSCRKGLCSTSFSSFNSSLEYHVSVTASNGIGPGSRMVSSINIGKSIAVIAYIRTYRWSC